MPYTIDNFINDSGMSSRKKKKAQEYYSKYYKQSDYRRDAVRKLNSAEEQGNGYGREYIEENKGFSVSSDDTLKSLDKWLLKHGETDTHARRTVAEFIIKRDDEKKAVWYIVEHNKYGSEFNEQMLGTALGDNYHPDIINIKKNLRRGKWERIKTFNRDNLAWGKLGNAVQTARPWIYDKRALQKLEENAAKHVSSPEEADLLISYQRRIQENLTNRLQQVQANANPNADNQVLMEIREKLTSYVNQLGEKEPEKEMVSYTETVVLRLGQFMEKSPTTVFLASDMKSDNAGFMDDYEDFSYSAGKYDTAVSIAGQTDNLLTVALALYAFGKAVHAWYKKGFVKGIVELGRDVKSDPVSFLLDLSSTLNDQAINASSAWSICNVIKAAGFKEGGFSDIIAASETIYATVDSVLSWATTIGSGLNTISKTAQFVIHRNQKKHADDAKYLLNDNSSKYIKNISKAVSGLKSDQKKEDAVGAISSALTTAAGALSLSGVGFGLGLVFSFVGAVGSFATWIAGISNRKKRRKHLIDTYLGISEMTDEKAKHEIRRICEAKLSIVDDERMAKYILEKYSRYLYNKVFLGNGKRFLVKNQPAEGEGFLLERYQNKQYVPENYYDKKADFIRKEKKQYNIVLRNNEYPSNESQDEIRERYAAYEILLAYGLEPKPSSDGDRRPDTTLADISNKLSV